MPTLMHASVQLSNNMTLADSSQVLDTYSCEADGYAVLTRLGQLASLGLKHNTHLPACLPQLTTLQELYVYGCTRRASEPAVVTAALNGALQHLTQASVGVGEGLHLSAHCAWGWVDGRASVRLHPASHP